MGPADVVSFRMYKGYLFSINPKRVSVEFLKFEDFCSPD